MKTSRRAALIASIVATVGMLALTAWAWGRVPDGARIPIHFGLRGNANSYVSKTVGLLLEPAIAVALSVYFYAVPGLDPRNPNIFRSRNAYNAYWLATVGLLALIHVVTVATALGRTVDRRNLISAAVGVAVVVMGNYMGKLRSNFFIGFRTPWTLSSDLSWNRTHRIGGRLLVGLGLLTVGAALVGLSLPVLVGGAVLVTVVTTVYSFLVWRGDPARVVHARGLPDPPTG